MEVVSHNNRQVPLVLLCLHVCVPCPFQENGQQCKDTRGSAMPVTGACAMCAWLCPARGRSQEPKKNGSAMPCVLPHKEPGVPAAGKTVATVATAGGYTDTSPPRDNGDQSGMGLSFGDASLEG